MGPSRILKCFKNRLIHGKQQCNPSQPWLEYSYPRHRMWLPSVNKNNHKKKNPLWAGEKISFSYKKSIKSSELKTLKPTSTMHSSISWGSLKSVFKQHDCCMFNKSKVYFNKEIIFELTEISSRPKTIKWALGNPTE